MRYSLKTIPPERLIFWSVAVLLVSQMAWWVGLQVQDSRRLMEARIATLRAGRAEAWQFDYTLILRLPIPQELPARPGVVEASMVDIPPLPERQKAIEARFPHVAVVASPQEADDPPLLDGRGYLALRPEPLQAMERERTKAIWRTSGQGAVLVSIMLLGMTYIYRRLSKEMDLLLRQRNFAASVTHEFKTPIASLRVWMETLFTRELPREQRSRIQEFMDKDLMRLDELVGNLLEVARMDAGVMDLHPEPMDLGSWIRTTCEAIELRFGPGRLGLRLNLSIGIWASIDPSKMATVMENLLSNAYKYAAEPRQTTVTLDGDGADALIVVEDKGHGIAPKHMPRLFHRFFRGGDEMTRQVSGTGLGLFLCREIVAGHGGEIRAASQGTGLGTTFTIRLPRLVR